MQNQIPSTVRDQLGFELPTPEAGRAEGRHRLGLTFRPGELIWLLEERYDPVTPAWNIDILRQGSAGRWVRQRHRFDEQAQVLYFLGENALTDAQFRQIRSTAGLFPVSSPRA